MHPYTRPPKSPAGTMHGDNRRQIRRLSPPTAAERGQAAPSSFRRPSTSRIHGRADLRVNFLPPPKVAQNNQTRLSNLNANYCSQPSDEQPVPRGASSIPDPASTLQQSPLTTIYGADTGLPQRTHLELRSQGEPLKTINKRSGQTQDSPKPKNLSGHYTNALINQTKQEIGSLGASLISNKRSLDQLHEHITNPRRVKKPKLCQADETTTRSDQSADVESTNISRMTTEDGRGCDSSLISRRSTASILLEITKMLEMICEALKVVASLCWKLQKAALLKNESRMNHNKRKRKYSFEEEKDLDVGHLTFTEHFDVKKIEQHIDSLEECAAKDKKKIKISEGSLDPKSCSLCGEGLLLFDPPPKNCSYCDKLISLNVVFYTTTSKYACASCYSNLRAKINGAPTEKGKMIKNTNNVAPQEPMVQCSNCQTWQHHICCLLNAKRSGEYICFSCRMKKLEKKESNSLSQKCFVGAENLPACNLSDFLQSRLDNSLRWERRERAKQLKERNIERINTAENLTIRVLASSDHVLTVPTKLLEIFDKKYPSGFPYRTKAIGLFQKIEGVDVLLFVMYVQEYGSDCPPPNRRHINLSYLDSVKHFTPNILTVNKEPLRSFVYQEILIGYLDYAKKRGFNSCYIWASPPRKSDSYILYSHPTTQKIPNADQLCKWYQNMIKKATDEKIVDGMTYIYDQYFRPGTKSQKHVTMARLPYFDGDYIQKAMEDAIKECEEEPKKGVSFRGRRAAELDTDSRNRLAQDSIMEKIREKIKKDKKTFILVHLRPVCASCSRILMTQKSSCYSCSKLEHKFKIKKKNLPKKLNEDKFSLVDTTDKDELMSSKIFDSRTNFLNFCERNNYQFDSLRRAKHSTMMCLYAVLNSMNTSETGKE